MRKVSLDPLKDTLNKASEEHHLLPDQDSNLNCQSQNLTYYHYTIGQWRTAKLFFYFQIIVAEFSNRPCS